MLIVSPCLAEPFILFLVEKNDGILNNGKNTSAPERRKIKNVLRAMSEKR